MNQTKNVVRFTGKYQTQHDNHYWFGCGRLDVNLPVKFLFDYKLETDLFKSLLASYCKVGINAIYWKLSNFEYRVMKIPMTELHKDYDDYALIKSIFGITVNHIVSLQEILNKTAMTGEDLMIALAKFGVEMINDTYQIHSGIPILYKVQDACTDQLDSRPAFNKTAKRYKIRYCRNIRGKSYTKIRQYIDTSSYLIDEPLSKSLFKMSPKVDECELNFIVGPEHSNFLPGGKEDGMCMVQFAYDLTRYVVCTFAKIKNSTKL